MFNGFKDPSNCYGTQPLFESCNQSSFHPCDGSKQAAVAAAATAAGSWDYAAPQGYNGMAPFYGEQTLNHHHHSRLGAALMHPGPPPPPPAPALDRKAAGGGAGGCGTTGGNMLLHHYNGPAAAPGAGGPGGGPLAHGATVVRPTAVINCQSRRSGACCSNHPGRLQSWGAHASHPTHSAVAGADVVPRYLGDPPPTQAFLHDDAGRFRPAPAPAPSSGPAADYNSLTKLTRYARESAGDGGVNVSGAAVAGADPASKASLKSLDTCALRPSGGGGGSATSGAAATKRDAATTRSSCRMFDGAPPALAELPPATVDPSNMNHLQGDAGAGLVCYPGPPSQWHPPPPPPAQPARAQGDAAAAAAAAWFHSGAGAGHGAVWGDGGWAERNGAGAYVDYSRYHQQPQQQAPPPLTQPPQLHQQQHQQPQLHRKAAHHDAAGRMRMVGSGRRGHGVDPALAHRPDVYVSYASGGHVGGGGAAGAKGPEVFTTGIAQPPTRFSPHMTYTQSKISRAANEAIMAAPPPYPTDGYYNPAAMYGGGTSGYPGEQHQAGAGGGGGGPYVNSPLNMTRKNPQIQAHSRVSDVIRYGANGLDAYGGGGAGAAGGYAMGAVIQQQHQTGGRLGEEPIYAQPMQHMMDPSHGYAPQPPQRHHHHHLANQLLAAMGRPGAHHPAHAAAHSAHAAPPTRDGCMYSRPLQQQQLAPPVHPGMHASACAPRAEVAAPISAVIAAAEPQQPPPPAPERKRDGKRRVLDVRHFLATWDEESEDLAPTPAPPPVYDVEDCRSVGPATPPSLGEASAATPCEPASAPEETPAPGASMPDLSPPAPPEPPVAPEPPEPAGLAEVRAAEDLLSELMGETRARTPAAVIVGDSLPPPLEPLPGVQPMRATSAPLPPLTAPVTPDLTRAASAPDPCPADYIDHYLRMRELTGLDCCSSDSESETDPDPDPDPDAELPASAAGGVSVIQRGPPSSPARDSVPHTPPTPLAVMPPGLTDVDAAECRSPSSQDCPQDATMESVDLCSLDTASPPPPSPPFPPAAVGVNLPDVVPCPPECPSLTPTASAAASPASQDDEERSLKDQSAVVNPPEILAHKATTQVPPVILSESRRSPKARADECLYVDSSCVKCTASDSAISKVGTTPSPKSQSEGSPQPKCETESDPTVSPTVPPSIQKIVASPEQPAEREVELEATVADPTLPLEFVPETAAQKGEERCGLDNSRPREVIKSLPRLLSLPKLDDSDSTGDAVAKCSENSVAVLCEVSEQNIPPVPVEHSSEAKEDSHADESSERTLLQNKDSPLPAIDLTEKPTESVRDTVMKMGTVLHLEKSQKKSKAIPNIAKVTRDNTSKIAGNEGSNVECRQNNSVSKDSEPEILGNSTKDIKENEVMTKESEVETMGNEKDEVVQTVLKVCRFPNTCTENEETILRSIETTSLRKESTSGVDNDKKLRAALTRKDSSDNSAENTNISPKTETTAPASTSPQKSTCSDSATIEVSQPTVITKESEEKSFTAKSKPNICGQTVEEKSTIGERTECPSRSSLQVDHKDSEIPRESGTTVIVAAECQAKIFPEKTFAGEFSTANAAKSSEKLEEVDLNENAQKVENANSEERKTSLEQGTAENQSEGIIPDSKTKENLDEESPDKINESTEKIRREQIRKRDYSEIATGVDNEIAREIEKIQSSAEDMMESKSKNSSHYSEEKVNNVDRKITSEISAKKSKTFRRKASLDQSLEKIREFHRKSVLQEPVQNIGGQRTETVLHFPRNNSTKQMEDEAGKMPPEDSKLKSCTPPTETVVQEDLRNNISPSEEPEIEKGAGTEQQSPQRTDVAADVEEQCTAVPSSQNLEMPSEITETKAVQSALTDEEDTSVLKVGGVIKTLQDELKEETERLVQEKEEKVKEENKTEPNIEDKEVKESMDVDNLETVENNTHKLQENEFVIKDEPVDECVEEIEVKKEPDSEEKEEKLPKEQDESDVVRIEEERKKLERILTGEDTDFVKEETEESCRRAEDGNEIPLKVKQEDEQMDIEELEATTEETNSPEASTQENDSTACVCARELAEGLRKKTEDEEEAAVGPHPASDASPRPADPRGALAMRAPVERPAAAAAAADDEDMPDLELGGALAPPPLPPAGEPLEMPRLEAMSPQPPSVPPASPARTPSPPPRPAREDPPRPGGGALPRGDSPAPTAPEPSAHLAPPARPSPKRTPSRPSSGKRSPYRTRRCHSNESSPSKRSPSCKESPRETPPDEDPEMCDTLRLEAVLPRPFPTFNDQLAERLLFDPKQPCFSPCSTTSNLSSRAETPLLAPGDRPQSRIDSPANAEESREEEATATARQEEGEACAATLEQLCLVAASEGGGEARVCTEGGLTLVGAPEDVAMAACALLEFEETAALFEPATTTEAVAVQNESSEEHGQGEDEAASLPSEAAPCPARAPSDLSLAGEDALRSEQAIVPSAAADSADGAASTDYNGNLLRGAAPPPKIPAPVDPWAPGPGPLPFLGGEGRSPGSVELLPADSVANWPYPEEEVVCEPGMSSDDGFLLELDASAAAAAAEAVRLPMPEERGSLKCRLSWKKILDPARERGRGSGPRRRGRPRTRSRGRRARVWRPPPSPSPPPPHPDDPGGAAKGSRGAARAWQVVDAPAPAAAAPPDADGAPSTVPVVLVKRVVLRCQEESGDGDREDGGSAAGSLTPMPSSGDEDDDDDVLGARAAAREGLPLAPLLTKSAPSQPLRKTALSVADPERTTPTAEKAVAPAERPVAETSAKALPSHGSPPLAVAPPRDAVPPALVPATPARPAPTPPAPAPPAPAPPAPARNGPAGIRPLKLTLPCGGAGAARSPPVEAPPPRTPRLLIRRSRSGGAQYRSFLFGEEARWQPVVMLRRSSVLDQVARKLAMRPHAIRLRIATEDSMRQLKEEKLQQQQEQQKQQGQVREDAHPAPDRVPATLPTATATPTPVSAAAAAPASDAVVAPASAPVVAPEVPSSTPAPRSSKEKLIAHAKDIPRDTKDPRASREPPASSSSSKKRRSAEAAEGASALSSSSCSSVTPSPAAVGAAGVARGRKRPPSDSDPESPSSSSSKAAEAAATAAAAAAPKRRCSEPARAPVQLCSPPQAKAGASKSATTSPAARKEEEEGAGADAMWERACAACGRPFATPAERAAHVRQHRYHCQRCDLAFRSQAEFVSHLSARHPSTRERHHCLLCARSFPSGERHALHVRGRLHRALEGLQRRTVHALFSLLTGRACPGIAPLSAHERAALRWLPAEPGAVHFYHQATPLQMAIQDWTRRQQTDAASGPPVPLGETEAL